MAIFSILGSSLSPPRGATPLSLSLRTASYYSYSSSNPSNLDLLANIRNNYWREEIGKGDGTVKLFLSWTSFTGGNSTNPFERFQGLARPSTKSNWRSPATELSRGAEASQVYDRDFFFGFIARHPSLGQWTGAIARREGSLSKENEKILFPPPSPPISISDLTRE